MAIWSRFFGNAASSAAGFGIGAAVSPALRPLTQDITNETWKAHPSRPLSPQDAALAVVRDLMDEAAAAEEAAMNGYDGDRFRIVEGLAGEPPGNQQLLELLNRGAISEERVDRGLRQSRMRPEWYDAFKQLRHVLVPVGDLVRFAVREVFSPESRRALDLDAEYPDALTARAAQVGLSEQAAREYWAAHWQLPSAEQGFEMYHRGQLSSDQLDGLLKALDYAPTWRGKLRTLANRIPPISDMIRFAVREVYDPAQRKALGLDADYPEAFTAEAALQGMDEERARQYWAAHWRLPSAQQGYQMLWRGEISADQLDGLLKALDYPAVWRDRLANIAYHVPGRIDLRRMYAAGLIDRAELVQGYGRIGYAAKDAEQLADLAVALSAGGSDSHVTKAKAQLWSTTHRSYLSGESDDTVAAAALKAAGVADAETRDVLALWKHERDLIRKQLTPAQVKKAFAKAETNPATGQPWTRDDALAELVQRGYSTNDATSFLDL